MKIKNYLFRFAVGLTAFAFGMGLFNVGRYVISVFQTKEQKTESVALVKNEPVKIEQLTYPPRNVQIAKTSVSEQITTNTKPEEQTFCRFDAGGDYYIIGDLPKGFEDFDTLSIVTRDYETDPENTDGIPISPKGYILTSKEFKFTQININGKEISFETQTKRGISYKFSGRFVDKPKATDDETDYPELTGRLIKRRDGKKIAEARVDFGVMCGC